MRRSRPPPPQAMALAAPALLWLLLFATFPLALQNFPLNDDWSYSRGVFALARGEGIHYYGWSAVPLLGLWLWAWPFVQMMGESHAALRLSVVLLAGLGIAAFVSLLRSAGESPRRAGFLGAALALNPLFFVMSGTFMSDIPALSFSLIALALYVRALQSEGGGVLAAATAAALLAVTTRQNAIAVSLTAAVMLMGSPRLRTRPVWVLAILGPLIVGVATNAWFARRPDAVSLVPGLRGLVHLLIPSPRNLLVPFYRVFTSVHFLGLAVLPSLLLAGTREISGARRRLMGFLVLFLGGAVAFGLTGTGEHLFPYLGNMITHYGQFYQGDTVLGARPLIMGPSVRLTLTLAGCLAGAWFLARLRLALTNPLVCFSGMHVILLLPRLVHLPFFDRYLLVLVPGALYLAGAGSGKAGYGAWSRSGVLAQFANLALPGHPGGRQSGLEPIAGAPAAAPASPRVLRAVAAAALVTFGLFSLALMHDWLSGDSARWELGRRALARGVLASEIEGGFEWDGWYSPRGAEGLPRPAPPRGLALSFTRAIFPSLTGRYGLGFSVPPGARALDSEPYRLWLVPGTHRIYLVTVVPEGSW